MTDAGSDVLPLIRELCAFPSGVVADGNADLFARLGREVPLTLHRYASGEEHNGWIVPPNWRVETAELRKDGRLVFDGRDHTLGVGRLSRSFQGPLDWADLAPHLVTNPDLPDAYMFHCMWQYRPWAADWAFSVPHRVYRDLTPGRYQVDLVTAERPGEMLVGDCLVPGRTSDCIVFNTNTCHPHQANDGFAAVALLVRLFQWLAGRSNHYSYRLILAPEHLGSVFWLRDRSDAEIASLVSGIFMEMPGTAGPIKVASTFLGDQTIDRAARNAARHCARAHEPVPWRRGAGNDETVWEAPGYEVPFVEMTRSENISYPYREYHSSLDSADLMDPVQLDEMYRVLEQTVLGLEEDCRLYRKFRGLICLSNPRYDLYCERFDPTIDKSLTDDADAWGQLLDSLFRYFDGSLTVLEIAERHGLPFARLRRYLDRYADKGLVDTVFAPIRRPPLNGLPVPPMASPR